MDELDLTEWPSVDEAAVLLKTSRRSVIRHNERGELEFRKRTRAGKKPENVVNPIELNKLLEKAAPRPFPVPSLPAPASELQFHPDAFTMTVPALKGEQIDRFLDALREMTAQRALPAPAAEPTPPPDRVPLHLKLNLTLEEAAVYSGYSALKLRQAIAAGRLTATKDGRRGAYIIRRASLEAL
jgi:excisionase family DNA binding protein